MMEHATEKPWITATVGPRYGTDESYILAAEWLRDCQDVSDWGGGFGYAQRFFPMTTRYRLIDGTNQVDGTELYDLAVYREQADGILMRHVLEINADWQRIILNAVFAFRRRLAIVTYTPPVPKTRRVASDQGWPVFYFNHEMDLIPIFGSHLRRVEHVNAIPTRPERVYCLER